MKDLKKRRMKALMTSGIYAIGAGTVVGIAPPTTGIPTQIVMTATDITMCLNIWKIYFEEELSQKDLMSMITEMGLVTVTATGAAYIFANLTSAVVSDIFWGVGSGLTITVNGIFAALWISYCEQIYQQRGLQPTL